MAQAAAQRERRRNKQVIIDDPPPPLKLSYAPSIGLNGAIEGRMTNKWARTVDEIVEVDDDLQKDMQYFNDLIEFILRQEKLPGNNI